LELTSYLKTAKLSSVSGKMESVSNGSTRVRSQQSTACNLITHNSSTRQTLSEWSTQMQPTENQIALTINSAR
jgi:hypothetical protein